MDLKLLVKVKESKEVRCINCKVKWKRVKGKEFSEIFVDCCRDIFIVLFSIWIKIRLLKKIYICKFYKIILLEFWYIFLNILIFDVFNSLILIDC